MRHTVSDKLAGPIIHAVITCAGVDTLNKAVSEVRKLQTDVLFKTCFLPWCFS